MWREFISVHSLPSGCSNPFRADRGKSTIWATDGRGVRLEAETITFWKVTLMCVMGPQCWESLDGGSRFVPGLRCSSPALSLKWGSVRPALTFLSRNTPVVLSLQRYPCLHLLTWLCLQLKFCIFTCLLDCFTLLSYDTIKQIQNYFLDAPSRPFSSWLLYFF